jgi:16S rRNA (adenine1518-N6/adenine1519-N6)-dimethyltransferase
MSRFDKRKAFGQHFLKDQTVIRAIVDASTEALLRHPEHSLLEIGPGIGALTLPVLDWFKKDESKNIHQRRFILAERDRVLIDRWSGYPGVSELLTGDVLDHHLDVIRALGPMVVMSNLPYSAGTAIVVRLVECVDQIPEMILMFQAEVAKRLYANPSTPDRGSLSLHIQNYYDIQRLCVVPAKAFEPPPKVMSEVVHLVRRKAPQIEFSNPEEVVLWRDLLKTAFAHRRKMLRGNFSASRWKEPFEKSAVDPTRRAESLTWDDWKAIWNHRK